MVIWLYMISIDTTLQLKALETHDQAELLTLMQTIYPPVYGHLWEDGSLKYLKKIYGESNFQQELSEGATHYLRVYVEEVPSGVLRVIHSRKCPDFPERSAMKLQRIFLHPETHGKGIGKKIMDWVVDQAKQEGKDLLWLECMDTQQQALRFYEKMGFQRGGAFDYPSDKMKKEFRGMIRMWKEVP